MFYQLVLDNISVDVHLGHLEKERSLPQRVLLDITLRFVHPPLACLTDDLHDTICYASLSCDLQKFCAGRSFKLIETLGYQLYHFIKLRIAEITPEKIDVFLCITKNPLLANLSRSRFEISD
jgi:dihydroneopterin aldolase